MRCWHMATWHKLLLLQVRFAFGFAKAVRVNVTCKSVHVTTSDTWMGQEKNV